eukprot:TRINITY_DN3793_c0_g1_i1.p2 TRINITY_DN3793_c0_g1~~TRINITY_DN3793_c0_g1_i1.p2  ORF type:complete len:119 (-),score=32.87 TRINITY_DN3793_c0_g1_i1:168-524(-)
MEVHNITREILSNREEKEWFSRYMEDFNTGTFPSKKYYNLRLWEMKEAEKESKKTKKIRQHLTDEERLRIERLEAMERRAKEAEDARVASLKQALKQQLHESRQEEERRKSVSKAYGR